MTTLINNIKRKKINPPTLKPNIRTNKLKQINLNINVEKSN